jgi:hypothetical protein
MNAKKLVASLFAALFIIIAAVYVLRYSQLLGNVLFLLPPLLAVVCGLYAVRTYHFANVHGKSMALLTTGLLCLFIGELLFFLFQFVFHINPFPSVADIFYLAAYPLLLAGLLREITLHHVSWRDLSKLVLALVLLLMVALVFIVAYFGVFLAYNPGDAVINNSIAIAYGIADLMLIVPSLFILNMALDYRGGKLFNSWILILLALIFMMAGDILFAIFRDKYTSLIRPYTFIDLTWVASYLFFAYSFFYTTTTIKELDLQLLK